MTKTKNTKRALLLSALALLICVSMLVGSTFAWFTDTVTTGSNVIQVGTLDIVLEYWDGDSWENAEGQVLEFIKGGNYHGYVGEALWEPGCTYELPKIRVRNEGNLAAKVLLRINGIVGDEELLDAIDFKTKVSNVPDSLKTGSAGEQFTDMEGASYPFWYNTPDGTVMMDWNVMAKGHTSLNTGHTDTSAEFTISGHMKQEAGNEYQGMRIESVSITALATQDVYEYDSFGREYDKNAEYPVVEFVTAEELATELTPVNGEITLDKDYIVTGDWTSIAASGNVVIDGKGHTISGLNKPLVAGNVGGSLTVKDLTIANSNIGPAAFENGLGTGAFASYKDAAGSVISFENCHLVNSTVESNYCAGGLLGYNSGAVIVITDCSVVNCEITGVGGAAGLVAFTQKNATITNSKVESTKVTATEDRLGTKTPLAGAIIGTANSDAVLTFTGVESIGNTVSNNNATAVYSEKIGRLVGNATLIEN